LLPFLPLLSLGELAGEKPLSLPSRLRFRLRFPELETEIEPDPVPAEFEDSMEPICKTQVRLLELASRTHELFEVL